MSRIARRPINIPDKVEVKLEDNRLEVKGPLGSLSWLIPQGVEVVVADNQVTLKQPSSGKINEALFGLTRAYIANMVKGVRDGFYKRLRIEGVGYRAELKGEDLVLQLGFSHPVVYHIPSEITVKVEGNTIIEVKGVDKQRVGQVAAEIRGFKPPEPYKGKGIRYENEYVRRKPTKRTATK